MSIWGSIKDVVVGGGAKALASGAAEVMGAVDNLKIGDGEKAELRVKLMDRLIDAELAQQETIRAEMASGGWLGKNWRPILAVQWGFILTYTYWVAPMLGLPVVALDDRIYNLLVVCITGYGTARTMEKVAGKVVPYFSAKQLIKKLKLEVAKENDHG